MRWYRSSGAVQKILLVLMGICIMFPLAWTVVNSFEDSSAYRVDNLILWISRHFSLEQYRDTMFYNLEYWFSYWNTILLTVPTVALALAVDSMAAYGLTVMKRKLQNKVMFVYALLALVPMQVLLVPHLIVLTGMNLTGTRLAVILVSCFSPWYLFFLYRLCRQIPEDVFEMARVEGAGEWLIFRKIALPQMVPGLMVFAVIISADLWGMVDEPLVYIQDSSKYPLSVYFAEMDMTVPYAGVVLLALPVVTMFIGMLYTVMGKQEGGNEKK